MFREFTIDFETGAALELKSTGIERQIECPHFRVNCLGYAPDDARPAVWTHYAADPRELLDHVEKGGEVVAHNGPFEYAVWNWLAPQRGWPRLRHEQINCTMARALALSLPGGLDKACEAMRLPFEKDARGRRAMLKFAKPKTLDPITWHNDLDDWLALLRYCAGDIEAERALHKALPPLSPQERQMWVINERINQRGVPIDADSVGLALAFVKQENARISAEVKKLTKIEGTDKSAVQSVNQTKAIIAWLSAHGIDTETLRKNDVTRMLADKIGHNNPDIRALLELRAEGAKASTAKLKAMANRACSDGRARGVHQYHGAGTGRAAGRGIQTQNLTRPPKAFKPADAVFVINALRLPYDDAALILREKYGSVLQAISWAMRGFIAA